MPAGLAALPATVTPLLALGTSGLDALRQMANPALVQSASDALDADCALPEKLALLVDELARAGRGVILTMGKGGVGKTTLAAAIAVALARRGHPVHLSTTDPAAHVAEAVGESIANLTVSRIDPAAEVAAYQAEVLAKAAANLDPNGRAMLEEDLRSPCTEEIAVFRAFARAVDGGQEGFVVLDTAPTGHTILLLDAAEAYHREVSRTQGDMPESVRQLLPRLRDPELHPGAGRHPARRRRRSTRPSGCNRTCVAPVSSPSPGSSTRASWPAAPAIRCCASAAPPRSPSSAASSISPVGVVRWSRGCPRRRWGLSDSRS